MCRGEMLGISEGQPRVDSLETVRESRLRWFGHVERAGGGALNEVRELRVEDDTERLTSRKLI